MRRGVRLLMLAAAAIAATASGAPAYPGCAPGPDLRFRASDGTRLVGHRFGSGKTFVVLAHQYGGDLCEWAPYAQRLASLGYTALAVDLRGFGLSQKRYGEPLFRYDLDVVAAVTEARRLGAKRVFVAGASLGGNAAVAAGAQIAPRVDGVVSLSGPATFRLDAVAAARKLRMPVLYLAARFDGTFADEARQMYAATPAGKKAITILPGGEHGVALVSHPGRARTLLEGFLRRS